MLTLCRKINKRTVLQASCAGVIAGSVALLGCGGGGKAPDSGMVDLKKQAAQLAREALIIDTHVDVPYRMLKDEEDISIRSDKGHFDYPRAKEGGLAAAFMSIYIPASYQETGDARVHADELIDMVEDFEKKWPEKFAIARSTGDVRRYFERGLISLPMGMENGAAIENDLSNVEYFYNRGIRYITLTHSKNNQICDSSYDEEKKWNGLSPFGRELVAEMNRIGIMVDISHVSDEAFYEVMKLSRAPVIASHSSCRHFTPGFERNMSDDMIRMLASRGGVIQINFGSAFINKAANEQIQQAWETVDQYLKDHGLTDEDAEADEQMDLYWDEHPRVEVRLGEVVDHIDHVVSLVGIEHVGIGSDFDGVSSLPVGLEDVSKLPNLIEELLRRGYAEEDILKILGGNLMRVWSEVERYASLASTF